MAKAAAKVSEPQGLPKDNPLPGPVRRQMEEAAKVHEAVYNPEPANNDAPQDPPAQPAVEPAAEGAPPPAASTPPAQTPAAATPPAEDQKLRSLQGRLEKEQQANQEMRERMNAMERMLADMQARTPPAPTEPPAPPVRLVKPEEEDEFGKELLDVVGRRATEAISPQLQILNNELSAVKAQLTAANEARTRDGVTTLYDKLTEAVPEWRVLNKTPEFIEWLNGIAPYSTRPKGELLREAFTRQDAGLVVNFFKGYLSEAASPPTNTPGNGTSTTPLPGNGQGNGKPALEDFAAPSRARSAPPVASAEKPIYTHADIQRFMSEKLTGKWKGRETEADAREADIFLAQREGRIIVQR